MKPITVDFSGVSEQGGFYIEPGTYKAVIKKVVQGKAPGGEYPYLEWTFDLPENGHVQIRDRTSLSPKAVFNLYNLIAAVTGKQVGKTQTTFDPEKLKGRALIIRVADRVYDGKQYSDVKAYMPMTASIPRAATPTPPVAPSDAMGEDDEELPF
jgi:hypothetical protein